MAYQSVLGAVSSSFHSCLLKRGFTKAHEKTSLTLTLDGISHPEAEKAMEQALGKWVSFFASSGKYPVVGKVLREEGWEKTAPEPPAICENAMKKRPIRGGGKLDAVMNAPLKMGGDGGIMRDNDRDEL